MYAIDTTLFYDINSIPDVEHSLNAELSKIADWLAANKYLLMQIKLSSWGFILIKNSSISKITYQCY